MRAGVWIAVMAILALLPQHSAMAQAANGGGQASGASAPGDRDLPIEGEGSGRRFRPQWTEMPSADQMAEFYPKLGQFLSLRGRTTLDCLSTSAGTLEHCKVSLERPEGVGFGEAALQLAPAFHFKPGIQDGAAVGGDEITLAILWQLPPNLPPTSDAPPTIDKDTLALAKRLAIATGDDKAWERQGDMIARTQAGENDKDAPAQAGAVVQAFDEALRLKEADYLDFMARELATTFSKDQLAALATFMESPVGQAWTANNMKVSTTYQQAYTQLWQDVAEVARSRFCAKVDCLTPDGSEPADASHQPPGRKP